MMDFYVSVYAPKGAGVYEQPVARGGHDYSVNASPLNPPSSGARGGTIWRAALPFP